jgi:hypothetical protein
LLSIDAGLTDWWNCVYFVRFVKFVRYVRFSVSASWNFDETPVELDSDDSSDGEEFALSLD